MGNFEPVGERARWRELYDHMMKLNIGDLFTFEEMGELLQLDPDVDKGVIRGALYRAAEEFLEKNKRAIAPVRGIGYRVVQPKEQLQLARVHQRRSTRALGRGQAQVEHVDLSQLDPETRKAFGVVGTMLAMQFDMGRRAERKLRDHDSILKSLVETSDRTSSETEQLMRRVADLERRLAEG